MEQGFTGLNSRQQLMVKLTTLHADWELLGMVSGHLKPLLAKGDAAEQEAARLLKAISGCTTAAEVKAILGEIL